MALADGLRTNDPRVVNVVGEHPDLLEDAGLSPEDALATGHARVVHLPEGRWKVPPMDPSPFGLFVVDGVLERSVSLDDRDNCLMFGPGDVLQPWPASREYQGGGLDEWSVRKAARLAILDRAFFGRACPELTSALLRRAGDVQERLVLMIAIERLPRTEQRVLLVLRQIATLWGKATPRGLELPIRLTHEDLGRIIGARRPTTSIALSLLIEQDLIDQLDDGRFVVRPRAQEGSVDELLAEPAQVRP